MSHRRPSRYRLAEYARIQQEKNAMLTNHLLYEERQCSLLIFSLSLALSSVCGRKSDH
jgi:hypothetical protein